MTTSVLVGAWAAGSSSYREGCALGRVALLAGGSFSFPFLSFFVFSSFLSLSLMFLPFLFSFFLCVPLFFFFFYFVFFLPSYSFFFIPLVLLFSSPLPSREGIFIRGGGRDGYPTLVQLSWRGRVAGVAFVQPLAWLVSSAPLIMVVGHERMWVVLGFLGKWEGEGGRNKHCKWGGETFFPRLCASRGRRWQTVP